MADSASSRTATTADVGHCWLLHRKSTHAHCYFTELLDLASGGAKAVLPPVRGVPQHFIGTADPLAERLAAMEACGIDMEVLSINPWWYGYERDLAAQIVRINNEKLSELCARQPKRFAAFASLTLQVLGERLAVPS